MSGAASLEPVLLDTCAMIWLAKGESLSVAVRKRIIAAAAASSVYVSPISAWEIGLLCQDRPGRPGQRFMPDAKTWFARFSTGPGIRVIPLLPDIAIDASNLPGELHRDPADRMLIATARHFGMALVTRDHRIIAYARDGFVRAIQC